MADLLVGRKLYLSFILNSILLVRFKKIGIIFIIFILMKSLMLKCPVHELPHNIVINNFYAKLSGHYKDYLDTCFEGSFTSKEVEAKWDLLETVQHLDLVNRITSKKISVSTTGVKKLECGTRI
jgi:hypothetical protein